MADARTRKRRTAARVLHRARNYVYHDAWSMDRGLARRLRKMQRHEAQRRTAAMEQR